MDFLSKASDLYGKFEAESFSQDIFCELIEGNINSPIEDLFYIAIKTLAVKYRLQVNPTPEYDAINKVLIPVHGLDIIPQQKLGNYKVDFFIRFELASSHRESKEVIVELDGHDFHDKDKKQRSYEKARDRFFLKNGFNVMHFTGSDVVKDPFAVANEVLTYLGIAYDGDYSENNPMGVD